MIEIIKKISNDWQSYRDFCVSESSLGYEVKKVDKNHEVYDLVINQWKDSIKNQVNSSKYLIESSVGIGNLSAAPWLAIMDKSITESPREGFYVVFLFSRSGRNIYLTLGLGATQFENIHGRTNKCLEKISKASNYFKNTFSDYLPEESVNKIDLVEDDYDGENSLKGSSRFLVSAYECGTCFGKKYDLNNTSNNEIFNDISLYLEKYNQIIQDPKSENLNILAESFSELSFTKNKNNFYEVPFYKPREKVKNKKKVSVVYKAKSKRRTQESKKIGLAGENIVFNYEYEKLKKRGKEDLAQKIQKHYENNEFPGWDITSYNEDGEKIYIEVKSTSASNINSLEITNNEWTAAKNERENYHIYLVNNALNEKGKVFEILKDPYGETEKGNIEISTSIFQLKL